MQALAEAEVGLQEQQSQGMVVVAVVAAAAAEEVRLVLQHLEWEVVEEAPMVHQCQEWVEAAEQSRKIQELGVVLGPEWQACCP